MSLSVSDTFGMVLELRIPLPIGGSYSALHIMKLGLFLKTARRTARRKQKPLAKVVEFFKI